MLPTLFVVLLILIALKGSIIFARFLCGCCVVGTTGVFLKVDDFLLKHSKFWEKHTEPHRIGYDWVQALAAITVLGSGIGVFIWVTCNVVPLFHVW